MALKKSQLYSSLWKSCDELRGGMDASQYKDYVLTLLFMKYVSDKHNVFSSNVSPDATAWGKRRVPSPPRSVQQSSTVSLKRIAALLLTVK